MKTRVEEELDYVGEPCKSNELVRASFANKLEDELNSVNRRLAYRIRDIEKLKAELELNIKSSKNHKQTKPTEGWTESWIKNFEGKYVTTKKKTKEQLDGRMLQDFYGKYVTINDLTEDEAKAHLLEHCHRLSVLMNRRVIKDAVSVFDKIAYPKI